MKIDALVQNLRDYSLNVLAANAKTWMAKFAIGAGFEATSGRIEGFIRSTGCVSADGDVDLDALERIVKSGFKSAGHLDVFGGLIGFDLDDADAVFAHLKSKQ